jgi:hypothetical protein
MILTREIRNIKYGRLSVCISGADLCCAGRIKFLEFLTAKYSLFPLRLQFCLSQGLLPGMPRAGLPKSLSKQCLL